MNESLPALTASEESYLAGLLLYLGQFELGVFPENTQAVILQPFQDNGDTRVMILGDDTILGFGSTDQIWLVHVVRS